jgi:hypothetical protein
MNQLKLLPARVVGLAVVVVCTYRADCIPWADMVQIVAVSLHEGSEIYYVDREHIVSNSSSQEGHMFHKELPEGRTSVYVYEWERESTESYKT